MSFILDALKKSENDRQQAANPGIASVPTATPHAKTPTGVWLLVGALGVTIVLLLAVLLKQTPSTETLVQDTQVRAPARAEPIAPSAPSAASAQLPTATSVEKGSPTTAPVRQEDPLPAGRTLETESKRGDGVTAALDEAEVARPETTQPSGQSENAAAREDPVDETAYLTFNDLRASGNIGLPDLHIDLHVYSDNPSERFVFINMNQYRENSTLTEGPALRRITPEGVLLEYVGTTFLLPRD